MNPKSFETLNTLLGWLIFGIATTVFMLTLEPTASFWDCSERIACAYKLQVMHPPGAPLYQMLGRMFSLLALGDTARVAFWINAMSATAGGLTVMFLFWSIVMLGKKMVANQAANPVSQWTLWGAASIGALTLTFSDSFWFTAVEAEVYVTSLFLTALVFWSILKWEQKAHEPDSNRWLVFIAFIVGLSIGVHMLNLLAIPAIVFVYYFKKFEPSRQGFIVAGISAIALLGFIQAIFIPGVLTLDWWFERFFVNTLGLPFHSGTVFFFVMVISLIIFGLYYTHKKHKVVLNTIILSLMFILIGYTSFMMLVIRSNAHVPINENAPKDALALRAYLGREQYGSWPLLHGPYYNSPLVEVSQGKPVWRKDSQAGRYTIARYQMDLRYHPEFTTVFPRMWSDRMPVHARTYQQWGRVQGVPKRIQGPDGRTEVINKPTFAENLRFFFAYQINHMYVRYLMWNFSGRQNNIQGHGEPVYGNWISGIKPLDQAFLGPQSPLPRSITGNPAHTRYYLLPFILGIAGLVYQARRNARDAWVVALLFLMTGLAIVVYLNQTWQPRERDYSYIGSFYAFSIWVGLGMLPLARLLGKLVNARVAAIAAFALCLLLVPATMARENWKSHDRSGRYFTRDMAINYLQACAPNAIIFTLGDNDTFPLWYAQEVEGIRTDIKVVNLSLLNADWYIDGMTRRKTYNAPPLPYTLEPHQYRDGVRDQLYVVEDPRLQDQFVNVASLIRFISQDQNKRNFGSFSDNFFPTRKFRLPVDKQKVIAYGTVNPNMAHLVEDAVEWEFPQRVLTKSNIMMLDFLATNAWERPVYFSITMGQEGYIGLEDYFQLDGMAYRLVPIRTTREDFYDTGSVDTEILYNHLMHEFLWGNINKPGVYLSEDHIRLCVSYRNIFRRLAQSLIEEGQPEKAIEVLDRAMEQMPAEKVPLNFFALLLLETYFMADAPEKAIPLLEQMIDKETENLAYYFLFRGRRARLLDSAKQEALLNLQHIVQVSSVYGHEELYNKALQPFERYYQAYLQGY